MKLSKAYFVVFLIVMVLLSGCIEDHKETPAPTSQQTSSYVTENKTTIEKISDNLDMLKSNGWSDLTAQLGRPKTTAVLWYDLRTRFKVAPKVVFGRKNKLGAAIAIIARNKTGKYPTVTIKRVEYYVIDPTVPELITDFNYGDMFDDPGNNYLYDKFRLKKEDIEVIQEWMKKTGVSIEYADLIEK